MRLHWPDTVKVSGKQVAFIIKYVREDGREISSSRQVLKVPVSGTPAAAPPPVAANENSVAKPRPARAQ